MSKKILYIKCNQKLGNFKKDSIVQVAANENGKPLQKYWRNRLRDAEHDNCCEIVEKESDKKTGQKKKTEQSE